MKKHKKRNLTILFLLILLAVSIGYAILYTNLKINGLSHIAKGSWNIHWDNVSNEKGVKATTSAYIKDNKKQVVEFEVFLDKPGDFYEFTVDAVNEGTLDGVISSIETKVNDIDLSEHPEALPSYVKFSAKYLDGTTPALNDELEAEDSVTYKIRIEFDKDAVTNSIINNMQSNESYVFNYEVEYTQDPYKEPDNPVDFGSDPWELVGKEGDEAAEQEEVTNNKCGPYHLGDTRNIKMDMNNDGIKETYTVRIANCSTPPECSYEGYSQTACGFVLEFVDILAKREVNSPTNPNYKGGGNNGGWEYSDLRAYLNNGTYHNTQPYNAVTNNYQNTGIYGKLPYKLRKIIKDTTVVSSHGTKDPENLVTTDKLYLLTAIEVLGKEGEYTISDDTTSNNTRQLDYYESIGIVNSNSAYQGAVKNYNNTPTRWWTRTASGNNYLDFQTIQATGVYGWDYSNHAESSIGISPAFKIG